MKQPQYYTLICLILIGCRSYDRQPDNAKNIVGSWNWVKTYYHGQDTSLTWTNITGRLIFTNKDYSMTLVDQDGPRLPLQVLGWQNNTKEDLQNAFKPFISHGGHYKLEKDTVYLYREIAMLPNNMLPQNPPLKYKIHWIGDTLVLINDYARESWLRRN